MALERRSLRLDETEEGDAFPVWVAVQPRRRRWTRQVIELVGGIAAGVVWGWLLVQRVAEPAAAAVATLAAAALACEAALLAGRGAALGLLAGVGAGALVRAALERSLARREAAA